MEIEKITAMVLPDNSKVKIEASEGGFIDWNTNDKKSWKSIDVTLRTTDGRELGLLSVEYNEGKGLSVNIYDQNEEEAIFSKILYEINEEK